jgi:hypothetical protein
MFPDTLEVGLQKAACPTTLERAQVGGKRARKQTKKGKKRKEWAECCEIWWRFGGKEMERGFWLVDS